MVKSDATLRRQKTKGSSFMNETAAETTISPVQVNDSLREQQYLSNYQIPVLSTKMPNTAKCLVNSLFTIDDRATAIDFISEKAESLSLERQSAEFFRSITILDLYIKYKPASIETFDLELIALAALFLSIKYDNNVNSTRSLLDRLIKSTDYNNNMVLKAELNILKTLGFTLKYLSWFDQFGNCHFKFFSDITKESAEIKRIGLEMLMLCSLDNHFNDFCTNKLILSLLILAIRHHFRSKLECLSKDFKKKFRKALLAQENYFVQRIYENVGDQNFLKISINRAKKHLKSVSERYACCKNVLSNTSINPKML